MSFFIACVIAFLALFANVAFCFRIPFKINRPVRSRVVGLNMVFGSIAEKLGKVVEFVSGQGTITERNIEDTLKVPF